MIDADKLINIKYPGFDVVVREVLVGTLTKVEPQFAREGKEIFFEFSIKVASSGKCIPIYYHKINGKMCTPHYSFSMTPYHRSVIDEKEAQQLVKELGYPNMSQIWTDTIYKIGDPKDLSDDKTKTLYIKYDDFIYEVVYVYKGFYKVIGAM